MNLNTWWKGTIWMIVKRIPNLKRGGAWVPPSSDLDAVNPSSTISIIRHSITKSILKSAGILDGSRRTSWLDLVDLVSRAQTTNNLNAGKTILISSGICLITLLMSWLLRYKLLEINYVYGNTLYISYVSYQTMFRKWIANDIGIPSVESRCIYLFIRNCEYCKFNFRSMHK